MLKSFIAVLVTRKLREQFNFYQQALGLELLFDNNDTLGLGLNGQLLIVLRKETNANSHHEQENKGPIILTFQFPPTDKTDLLDKLDSLGVKLRGQHQKIYYFIEDYDGNELCLDFTAEG